MSIISKIFGTHSQHEVKRIIPIVNKIEALAPEFEKLTDDELKAKTPEFKERGAILFGWRDFVRRQLIALGMLCGLLPGFVVHTHAAEAPAVSAASAVLMDAETGLL